MINIKRDVQFLEARYILKNYNGFYHRMGYTYLFTPDSRGKDFKDLIPNVDYFTSDYHLKIYLQDEFNWTGPQNEHAIIRNTQNLQKSQFKIKIQNICTTFPEMRFILKTKYGFHYRMGSPYFFTAESRCKDFNDLIPNIDYFTSDCCLKNFLKNQHDWSERDISLGSKYDDNSKILVSPKVTRTTTNRLHYVEKVIFQSSKIHDNGKHEDPITKNENVFKGDTGDIKEQNVINTHKHKSKKRNRIIVETNPTRKKTKTNYSATITTAEHNTASKQHGNNSPLETKLDYCLQALCTNNTSEDSIFIGTGNSILTSKLKIISFLENSIRNDYETFKPSSVLYICGRPGTGKTMLVNNCLSTIKTSKECPACNSLYLNAASIVSYENVIEEIAGALGKKSNSTSNMVQAIGKTLKRKNTKPLILVIDEIDFLPANYERSKSKKASHMDIVFQWAAQIEFALTVICISNSVGDNFAKTFHKMVKIGMEVIFRPYSETDLVSIIQKRLGHNIHLIDPLALTFVARKIAKANGDARLVLDLMRSSIIKARETLTTEDLNTHTCDTIVVKLPHVMKAIKYSGAIPLVDYIIGLPSKAQTVLAIATTLGQVSSSWNIIPLHKLKKYCAEATRHEVFDDLSTESFYSIVSMLEDAGLIYTAKTDRLLNKFRYDDYSEMPIRVDVQMEDVEIALEQTLFNQGTFFTKLRDYVKTNDINNKSL